MYITGHCLIGHSQLAQWFCVDKDGKNVSPEILQQRMKNHINEVYSIDQLIHWSVKVVLSREGTELEEYLV